MTVIYSFALTASLTSMSAILKPVTPLPNSRAFPSGARLVLSLEGDAPGGFRLIASFSQLCG